MVIDFSSGSLLHVDLGMGHSRLGGSALAQCYKQVGKVCPDLENAEVFTSAFEITQRCISGKYLHYLVNLDVFN